MKTIVFLLSLLTLSRAYSFDKEMLVVERSPSFKVIEVMRLLTDLESEDSFDGKYFKIVKGKSNEAITFYANDELLLKAATTYFHLMKARRYFVEELKSDHVAGFNKLTIRLEIQNKFNELGHFAHDKLDPQFNNALSIPAGEGYARHGIDPWGKEIWFRPVKRVHVSEFGGTKADARALKRSLKGFRNNLHMSTFRHFLADILDQDIYRTSQTSYENVMRLVGSSIIMEAIYQSSGVAASFFARKWYKLDSALVPEIIYHEYSHLALSDHLELTHSTPVNEGMADYFAGKISGNKQLATRIRKYNLFNGKKVNKSAMYRKSFELTEYANDDFVFGLLWHAGILLGENNSSQTGQELIYSMRSLISTNSSIKDQLLGGILEVCDSSCVTPRVTKYKLYKLFHYKGL